MCPCGQGTEGGVGVTRPALWPSCQAVCILELTRAEGGAPGPVRLITGGQRPWGGPGSNGSPDWGHGLHHREAVSCLLMPPRPASRSWGSEEGGPGPQGPCPYPLGGAGLGADGEHSHAPGTCHSSAVGCAAGCPSREGRWWLPGSSTLLSWRGLGPLSAVPCRGRVSAWLGSCSVPRVTEPSL